MITEHAIAAASPRLAPLAAARTAIHARARGHGREMVEDGGGGAALWGDVLRSQSEVKAKAKAKAKIEVEDKADREEL